MSANLEQTKAEGQPGEGEAAELLPREIFEAVIRIHDERDDAIESAHRAAKEKARAIDTPSYEGAAPALLDLLPNISDRLRYYRHGDLKSAEEPIRRTGYTTDINPETAIGALCVAAQATGRRFVGEFMGIVVDVDPSMTPAEVWKSYLGQRQETASAIAPGANPYSGDDLDP